MVFISTQPTADVGTSVPRDHLALLDDLALIRETLAGYSDVQAKIDELKRMESDLKAELKDVLLTSGMERVRGSGFVAFISKRKTKHVVDLTAVKSYLAGLGVLDQYQTIDTARALDDFKDALPGVQITTTESLTVKESAE